MGFDWNLLKNFVCGNVWFQLENYDENYVCWTGNLCCFYAGIDVYFAENRMWVSAEMGEGVCVPKLMILACELWWKILCVELKNLCWNWCVFCWEISCWFWLKSVEGFSVQKCISSACELWWKLCVLNWKFMLFLCWNWCIFCWKSHVGFGWNGWRSLCAEINDFSLWIMMEDLVCWTEKSMLELMCVLLRNFVWILAEICWRI